MPCWPWPKRNNRRGTDRQRGKKSQRHPQRLHHRRLFGRGGAGGGIGSGDWRGAGSGRLRVAERPTGAVCRERCALRRPKRACRGDQGCRRRPGCDRQGAVDRRCPSAAGCARGRDIEGRRRRRHGHDARPWTRSRRAGNQPGAAPQYRSQYPCRRRAVVGTVRPGSDDFGAGRRGHGQKKPSITGWVSSAEFRSWAPPASCILIRPRRFAPV